MKKIILALLACIPVIISSAQNTSGRTRVASAPPKTRTAPETTGVQKNAGAIKNIFRTYLEEENLKGRVKYIYVAWYLAEKNEKTNEFYPVSDSSKIELNLRYFDKEGNLVVDTATRHKSTAYFITQYKYGKPGQLLEEINNEGGRWSYEYDEYGFIKKETSFIPGREPTREIMFREYEFIDANNYNYKVLRVDRKEVLSCHRYSIFSDGRLKMYSNGCDTANFNLKHVYTYDPRDKHLMRYDSYTSVGVLSSHTEYDKKGNEVKKVYHNDANKDNVEIFEYLSYDAAGNWTKKISTTDPQRLRFSVTERKIKYY